MTAQRTARSALLVGLVLLAGCFDSLLGTPCRPGFTPEGGRCVAAADGPDGGRDVPEVPVQPVAPDAHPMPEVDIVATPDAGVPDAPACTADVLVDPLNCGTCGHACASGICTQGACAGEVAGHVVAIGHDYAAANAPMRRVLGNAAALGAHHDLAIARWADASPAVTSALQGALADAGRPWHAVALPASPAEAALDGVDVVLVDPRTGDGSAAEQSGVAWAPALAAFLAGGGVVIVLEGEAGTNHRFAHGANLFDAGTPVSADGAHLAVVAPTDAVAQQVLSPYLAAASSVAFPALPAVIATPGGEAVVFHAARP